MIASGSAVRKGSYARWSGYSHSQKEGDSGPTAILSPRVQVNAHDGRFGELVGLRIASQKDRVTHLLVRRRHLLRAKVIPIEWTYVERIQANTIRLKLYRVELRSLEARPPRLVR